MDLWYKKLLFWSPSIIFSSTNWTLSNYKPPFVNDPIVDCTDFHRAIKVLETIYVKPEDEVLATCKQESIQSLDEFAQNLKSVESNCKFKIAEMHALTSGLQSRIFRQRLLENDSFSVQVAFDHACLINMAFGISQRYQLNSSLKSCLKDSNRKNPTKNPIGKQEYAAAASNSNCYSVSSIVILHLSIQHEILYSKTVVRKDVQNICSSK